MKFQPYMSVRVISPIYHGPVQFVVSFWIPWGGLLHLLDDWVNNRNATLNVP